MGKHNRGASTNIVYIICDGIFFVLSFLVCLVLSFDTVETSISKYAITCFIFMLAYMLIVKNNKLYNLTTFFYIDRVIRCISKAFLITVLFMTLMLYYVGEGNFNVGFYTKFLLVTYVFLLCSAAIMRVVLKHRSDMSSRTLMIGGKEHFERFMTYMEKSNTEIHFLGFVSVKPEDKGKEGYIGCVEELEKLIREEAVDQVYIMHRKSMSVEQVQTVIDLCMTMGVTARIIMDSYRAGFAQSYVSSVGTYPIVTYHTVSLNASDKLIKRCVDIVGSLFGLILASPIMLITAIAIKIDDPGPVIFKQKRVGMNGRQFNMYKFRSMCVDAEAKKKELMKDNEMGEGFMFKMHDDPRITKVGKFIRKTSVDEFPQFLNVLKGDMSLVGTRPPTLDEVELYHANHWRRISIKPGITGMWQVSGRSQITDFEQIVELDTEYIDKWNVLLDFKIMIMTVLQVFMRKGAC